MKRLITAIVLLLAAATANAGQVTDVKFSLRFNSKTGLYDVVMILDKGDIMAGIWQAASTAQVTLVVPAGSKVDIGHLVSNEPKSGFIAGGTVHRSANATSWINGNVIRSADLPLSMAGNDVYAFTPTVSKAFYPVAYQGDDMVLFSVAIATPNGANKQDIRLWNNTIIKGAKVTFGDRDATSAALKSGQQFNNGIGIGSPKQLYTGNMADKGSLGTPTMGTAANITIIPNPTITYTNIHGVEVADLVTVMDMAGNLVTSATANGNSVSIDMSEYASGVYNVFITRKNTMLKAGKIVRQ